MILIEIPGRPLPSVHHKGYGRRAYDPRGPEKKIIRTLMAAQYRNEIITCAVMIEMTFYLAYAKRTPESTRRAKLAGEIKHTQTPDTSNLYYLYENCLKELIIKDDAQVVEFTAQKLWCEPGKEKTIIKIHPCEETVIMPLKKSKSKEALKSNIKAEIASGKSKSKAVAIGLNVARKAGAKIPKKKATGKKG